MRRPTRDEDEAPGADLELAIPELERRLSVGDVERLVGVRVEVEGRPGLARGNDPTISTT
jgi:hypothetical protein